MKFFRFVLLACALAFAPAFARADDQPAHAETISGVVTRVDYANGTIEVESPNGRVRIISVSPSTTITHRFKSSYQDLSDIRPGIHVRVEASRSEGRLDAEVVTLGRERRGR